MQEPDQQADKGQAKNDSMDTSESAVLIRPVNCENWSMMEILDYLSTPYIKGEEEADIAYLMHLLEEKQRSESPPPGVVRIEGPRPSKKEPGETSDKAEQASSYPSKELSVNSLTDFDSWPTSWINDYINDFYHMDLPKAEEVGVDEEDAQEYHYLVQILKERSKGGPKPPETYHNLSTIERPCQ